MLRYFYTLLVLSVMGGFAYYVYQKNTSLLYDSQIIDAVHTPHLNPLFEKADKAKYNQDYAKAAIEFQQLLKGKLTTADSQYVFNQLAYINLNLNEDSIAYQWISHFERFGRPLSINAESDYNYNIGTWAYHTFKPKMAEEYLKKALEGYEQIYGKQHLKTAMCLTQLGHLFYEFSDYPDSIFNYMPRAYDIFQTNPHLKPFSGNNELGMVYAIYKAYIQWRGIFFSPIRKSLWRLYGK